MDILSYVLGLQAGKANGGGSSDIELIENLPIAVDFSQGNQYIEAPEGQAVKSAVIQKPTNLVPENIAKDVNIAGITGTLAAGGSSVVPYLTTTGMKTPSTTYHQRWFMYNGELYAAVNQNAGNSVLDFYKYGKNNDTWTKIITGVDSGLARLKTALSIIEYNGKIHLLGNDMKGHIVFDGTTATKINDLPTSCGCGAVLYKGNIIYCYKAKIYQWNEADDTWSVILENSTLNQYSMYTQLFVNGDDLYCIVTAEKNVYKLNLSANTVEVVYTFSQSNAEYIQVGTIIYGFRFLRGEVIYKFDLANYEMTEMGTFPLVSTKQVYDGKLKGLSGNLGSGYVHEVEYILPNG